MMKPNYLILLGFLVLFACKPVEKKAFDLDEQKKVEKEVNTMLHQYHEAISQEGLEGEFPYLDSTEQFFWVPPAYTSALDFDSVKSILLQNDKAMKQVDFHWEKLELFVLSPKIVNFTGIVGGQMLDTAGILSPVNIIESGTCIKREDGWKLLSGQSALLPSSP